MRDDFAHLRGYALFKALNFRVVRLDETKFYRDVLEVVSAHGEYVTAMNEWTYLCSSTPALYLSPVGLALVFREGVDEGVAVELTDRLRAEWWDATQADYWRKDDIEKTPSIGVTFPEEDFAGDEDTDKIRHAVIDYLVEEGP